MEAGITMVTKNFFISVVLPRVFIVFIVVLMILVCCMYVVWDHGTLSVEAVCNVLQKSTFTEQVRSAQSRPARLS